MESKKQFTPIRICSPQLGLTPESILGGEVFDRKILLGLAKRGVEIEIILPNGKDYDKGIKNWKFSFLPVKHFPAIVGNILYLPWILSIYNKKKFSILRLHQPQFLGISGIVAKFIYPKIKLVANIHQFNETNFGPLSNFINKRWDHIICDSENVKNKIIKTYNINVKNISVVHNGYPEYLTPSSKDKKLSKKLGVTSKFVLLYMGFLNERKNPLFLLEVLDFLKNKYKIPIKLIYIGEGHLKKRLEEQAKEMNLYEDILIINPVFGEDKLKFLNLADIFVHPSLDEGFSLAPIEAMACAKPILMNHAHSAREAISENGYICKKNPKDWAEKISALLKNKKLLKDMGNQSLKKAKNDFNWDKAITKHLEVFKTL